MSDDLVKRLRKGGSYEVDVVVMEEAACCIEELEQLFDLRWAADMRAIKAWRIAHPDQPKPWPDHADLGTWCLSRIEALEAALREIAALGYWAADSGDGSAARMAERDGDGEEKRSKPKEHQPVRNP